MATVYHVRAELEGESEDLDKYFALIKKDELRKEKYLNDITDFSSVDEEEDINALGFFVENIFRDGLLLVKTDNNVLSTSQINTVKQFVKNHAPVGTAMITAPIENQDYYPDGLMLDDSQTILSLDGDQFLRLY